MRKAILLLITTPAWAGELTVSSTGDGPKALLAYHIKDGAKQRAHVRFNVDINVEAGGVTQEQHAPIVSRIQRMTGGHTIGLSGCRT